jgi:membrane-associated phospholipid phosphatase
MPKSAVTPQKISWFFLPALVWVALFCLRPVFFRPWCAVHPTPCTFDAVNPFDQYGFYFHSVLADFLSNVLQNSMGVVLVLVPLFVVKERKRLLGLELFFVWGTLWNGVMIELSRTLAQRPRPLVMNSPFGEGGNINQYTSFYSGHTSFVAFATLTLALWLSSELGKSSWRARLAWTGYVSLTIITAILRVLGGRHFPTDTIAAAISGSVIAYVLWRFFGRKQMLTIG